MATKIQVHCVKAVDGKTYIVNRLSTENHEAGNDRSKRDALKNKALKMAYAWGNVYPNDKFMVVEA